MAQQLWKWSHRHNRSAYSPKWKKSSEVYRRNNNRPKTLPCCTPDVTLTSLLLQPSTITCCDRNDRNCVNRDNTEPPIPTEQSLYRIQWWLSLSKAATLDPIHCNASPPLGLVLVNSITKEYQREIICYAYSLHCNLKIITLSLLFLFRNGNAARDLRTLGFQAHTEPVPSQVFRFWYYLLLQLVRNSNHDWSTHTENGFDMISHPCLTFIGVCFIYAELSRTRPRCVTTSML